MKTALKIAWRYLFAKKQFNAIHIITAISSVAVGVVTAAMICVLSVMNGFGVMIEHLFSQFDPDLRITSQSGKSFVISEEKKSKLLELPSINLISESISETALAYFEEKSDKKAAFTYYPSVNEYQGRKTLQIIVQNYR